MTLLKSGSRGDLPSSSSSTSASAAESSSSQSSTKAGRGQQRGGRGGGGGCSSSCADKPRNSESSASGLVEEEEEASVSASCSASGSGSGSPPVSPRTDAVSQHFNNGHTEESLDGEALPVVMDNRNSGGGRIMTSSWAQRMHRRAATLGTVVTSCGHPSAPYPRRIEKVKFGVPVDEVCKNDIPGPLLVLILKLNKEAPYKKDVFRAPGHQGNMKKLIHFLQNGRLVNIDNFSVYTIASVLKKFLRKLPDGIFGRDGEQQLFQIIEMSSTEQQRDHIHSLISTLPVCTQRLIVLLFGTFRVIASNSERYKTGMTSEALGVSVAPSFFQSCVSDGKQAKMEDVMRFKVATKIMKFLIDNFGVSNLFGRENYEYYARITGRILKVEEDWIFSFRYPPDALVSRQESLEAEKTWLQYESERWGLNFNLEAMSHQEESHSTPALIQASDRLDADAGDPSSSLSSIPENNLLESYTRLSISLEDNGLFKVSEVLEEVHERQAARMKTRSEWFLSPSTCPKMPAIDVDLSNPYYVLRDEANCYAGGILSSSNESVKHPSIRRTSSKEKDRRLVRRSSSKKNKENGASAAASGAGGGSGGGGGGGGGGASSTKRHSAPNSTPSSTTIVDSNHQLSSPPSSGDGTIGGGGELDGGGGVEGGATTGTSLSPPPVTSTPGDKVPTPSKRSNASNLYDCDRPSGTPSTEEGGGAAGGAGGANVSAAGAGIAGAAGGPTNGIVVDGSSASDHATLVSELDCTETDVQTFHVTLTYKPRI